MKNVVLIGDSVFDNKRYVGKGVSTTEALNNQFRKKVGNPYLAYLAAVDGAYIKDVKAQLKEVPRNTSHLFLSVGGNDLLLLAYLLTKDEQSLQLWKTLQTEFEKEYAKMLKQVLRLGINTTICTVYNPQWEDKAQNKLAATVLSLFNDVIIKQATLYGLPVIDLRLVCDSKKDYANPIEPSSQGSRKIALVINHIIEQHNFSHPYSTVYCY